MTRLVLDTNGNPVPALRAGAARKGTAGATSTRIGPFTDGILIIEIYAAGDIRYQTGDANVTADGNSHFLAAGERIIRSLGIGPHTHLAIVRAGASDTAVEISELE